MALTFIVRNITYGHTIKLESDALEKLASPKSLLGALSFRFRNLATANSIQIRENESYTAPTLTIATIISHMALLEHARYTPHRAEVSAVRVHWLPCKNGHEINSLPLIFWQDFSPWREANLWLFERTRNKDVTLKTVEANSMAILAYANWLEDTGADWKSFPRRKSDRCLVQFRGFLIDSRNTGKLAPSTTSQRMACLIQFYKWLYERGVLSEELSMWSNRISHRTMIDKTGLERTFAVNSTDLAIPNRSAPGEKLEDGLLPVSMKDRAAILKFCQHQASTELFLLLTLGFFTGMRLGTLTDLRLETLDRAIPDPMCDAMYILTIGPGASPPVRTKFGVTGNVRITKIHLDQIRSYANSIHRLKREAIASKENKNLVFLTRFGNSYAEKNSDKSSAINVEMHTLRKSGIDAGISGLRNFHFHQTRCTYATELARLAIHSVGPINAIAFVKDALLHKSEATSFKYIRFVEKTPAKIDMANRFTRDFLGILTENSDDHSREI